MSQELITKILELAAAFLIAHTTSAGFWLYIGRKRDVKSLQTELLVGLAHDRIIWLAMTYLDQGYITKDAYENLHKYLFGPYEKLGGNGSAKRIMAEVDKLPIKQSSYRKAKTNDDEGVENASQFYE